MGASVGVAGGSGSGRGRLGTAATSGGGRPGRAPPGPSSRARWPGGAPWRVCSAATARGADGAGATHDHRLGTRNRTTAGPRSRTADHPEHDRRVGTRNRTTGGSRSPNADHHHGRGVLGGREQRRGWHDRARLDRAASWARSAEALSESSRSTPAEPGGSSRAVIPLPWPSRPSSTCRPRPKRGARVRDHHFGTCNRTTAGPRSPTSDHHHGPAAR
jgi:hypothetical protein